MPTVQPFLRSLMAVSGTALQKGRRYGLRCRGTDLQRPCERHRGGKRKDDDYPGHLLTSYRA